METGSAKDGEEASSPSSERSNDFDQDGDIFRLTHRGVLVRGGDLELRSGKSITPPPAALGCIHSWCPAGQRAAGSVRRIALGFCGDVLEMRAVKIRSRVKVSSRVAV